MDALRFVSKIALRNGAHSLAEKVILEYLDISRRLDGEETDHVDILVSIRRLGDLAIKKRKWNSAEK